MNFRKLFVLGSLCLAPLARAEAPAVHGMVLFGEKATYASHLPMFHAPHDYQVILKLKLYDFPRSQTLDLYDQAKHDGAKLFTMVPDVMDLTKVIKGERTEFYANIFVGHFERGGKGLGPVTVKVEKVLFAAQLDGDQSEQNYERYVVFGENGEYFASHIIAAKPSFDSILEVGPVMNAEPDCHLRYCLPTLAIPDTALPVVLTGLKGLPEEGDMLGNDNLQSSAIKSTLYLEVNELAD